MSDEYKSKAEQNARRIVEWLAANSTEFEAQGLAETSLAEAVGLTAEEATAAVDHLENREAVARLPHGLTPPQFMLQPARGWADVRAEILARKASGGHS